MWPRTGGESLLYEVTPADPLLAAAQAFGQPNPSCCVGSAERRAYKARAERAPESYVSYGEGKPEQAQRNRRAAPRSLRCNLA